MLTLFFSFVMSLHASPIELASASLYQMSFTGEQTPESLLNQYGALEEMHFEFLKDYHAHRALDEKIACKVLVYFQEISENCKTQNIDTQKLKNQWPVGTEIFVETEKIQEGQLVASQSDYSWTAFPPAQTPVKFYGRYEEFSRLTQSGSRPSEAATHIKPKINYWKWGLTALAMGLIAHELSSKKLIIQKNW